MLEKDYAQALYEKVATEPHSTWGKYSEKFFGVLRARGHFSLLPAIIRELEALDAYLKKRDELVVTLTDAKDRDAEHEDIFRIRRAIGKEGARVRVREDSSLVGGVVVETRNVRVDLSYKRALLDLYKRLVSKM